MAGGDHMSLTVCVAPADTIGYPQGGVHLWVYLQWALALKALGCRVIWLEGIDTDAGDGSAARRRRWRTSDVRTCVAILKERLVSFGLPDALALYPRGSEPLPRELTSSRDSLPVGRISSGAGAGTPRCGRARSMNASLRVVFACQLGLAGE